MASNPRWGTLLVRNASINPAFTLRHDVLVEPAYYSPVCNPRRFAPPAARKMTPSSKVS
ncbi:MAG: hypothetical protein R2857_13195 [Vampirovibrionales bacterium]